MPIHPHLLFEVLAYGIAFRLLRRAHGGTQDAVPIAQRVWLLVAAVGGAAIGAKLLFILEDPWASYAAMGEPSKLFGGRTIIGAFLGGWLAVEVAKWANGISKSTGDLLVRPLWVGLAIGRLGCFFSGVSDGTHGLPSSLPWAMDLGDGVLRHPTALYEFGYLLVFGLASERVHFRRSGDRFLAFMGLYLLFRFGVEFIKTQPRFWWGLSSLQVASVVGLVAVIGIYWRRS